MNEFLPNEDCVLAVIDNIPSNYFKLALTQRPNIPTPNKQMEVTDILGRMGSFYEHFAYKDMEITLDFNYLEDVVDYKAFKQQFYNIRAWLLKGKQLILSDEPNIYYVIKNVVLGDADNEIVEYGEFSASLTLAPFGRIIDNNPIHFASQQLNDVSLLIETVETAFPKVEFTASTGTSEFRINDTMVRFKSLTVGSRYAYDSDLHSFYNIDSNGNYVEKANLVQTLIFPTFEDGINLFYCKDMTNIDIYTNILR